jgi:serine/threonine protein kinase
VIVSDFGISSITDDLEKLHKTQTASRTTSYAAPEVFSGIISPKMDYYALGISLWELLSGKDPFALENGKHRNDAHMIRSTIEGRIADGILSREPRLSKSMERLIRGLLVIDHEYRWGYDEVTRHLAGEEVRIYKKEKMPGPSREEKQSAHSWRK